MSRRLAGLVMVIASSLMAQTIGYDLLKITGVTLSPADANTVRASFAQAPRAELTSLLPYSVVLRNNSQYAIVAYTLHLSFVDQLGKVSGQNRMYYNLESKSNGMEIEPGSSRLITPIDSLSPSKVAGTGPSSSSTAELTSQIAGQKSVTVSLDLLVLDTGQVFGKDEFGTLSFLQGYVAGGQDAANLVETGLAGGSSLANISAQLGDLARRTMNTSDPAAMGRINEIRRLSRIAGQNSRDRLLSEVHRIRGMRTWNFYR
jgi:hypothetical protein